jgi:hypothetical protein
MSDNTNESTGRINFTTGMKLPAIYGPYSSHEITIGLSIPADRSELENFEEVVSDYLERTMLFQRKVINAVCSDLEIDEIFEVSE